MSRVEDIKEMNENIKDTVEKYRGHISAEQERDMGLGFLISLLMRTNEMLSIIADDIERRRI